MAFRTSFFRLRRPRPWAVAAAIISVAALVLPALSPAQTPTVAQADGAATLTFVRASRFVSWLENAIVRVDGKVVARVANGKTVAVQIPAGDHVLDIRTDDDFGRLTMPFMAEGGRAYRVDLVVQAPAAIIGVHGAPLYVRPAYASDACGGRWCATITPDDKAPTN